MCCVCPGSHQNKNTNQTDSKQEVAPVKAVMWPLNLCVCPLGLVLTRWTSSSRLFHTVAAACANMNSWCRWSSVSNMVHSRQHILASWPLTFWPLSSDHSLILRSDQVTWGQPIRSDLQRLYTQSDSHPWQKNWESSYTGSASHHTHFKNSHLLTIFEMQVKHLLAVTSFGSALRPLWQDLALPY